MKILIIGAGILGSRYAVGLQKAGHEVTLLARGRRLEDLRQHGIVLEEIESGQRTQASVALCENLESGDVYDLALVIMRSNQTASVLPALSANPNIPAVIFMGNNVQGAGEFTRALGYERVLLGFAGAGGVFDGHVIRYTGRRKGQDGVTYLGEPGGSITPRLQQVASAFTGSGFPAELCADMDAWLKYHVALISPLAYAVYMAGGDIQRAGRTRDILTLTVRAIREGFQALQKMGMPVTPPQFKMLQVIPEPLLVAFLGWVFAQPAAEVNIAGHANAARDEMQHLAQGYKALLQAGSAKTPNLDVLYLFDNPEQPPAREGLQNIPLDWRGVWALSAGLAALVGAAVGAGMLVRQLLRKK